MKILLNQFTNGLPQGSQQHFFFFVFKIKQICLHTFPLSVLSSWWFIQILQLPCKQNRSREGTPTADAWGKCRQYKWQQKLWGEVSLKFTVKVIFFEATIGSKNYTICKMHVRNIFQTDWGQLISLYTMSNNGFFTVSFILQWTVYFNAWLSCRETLLDQIFVYNFHSIYCSVFPISLIVTITFGSCQMIASQETWNWVAINVQDLIWFHQSTCM